MNRWKQCSDWLTNGGLVLYLMWILLPTLTALGHAWLGALAIGVFGVGVLLDREGLSHHGLLYAAQAVGILALAAANVLFLRHGGSNRKAQFIQSVMFFFPVAAASYFRTGGKMWQGLKKTVIACVTVTALVTLLWNVYGMIVHGANGEAVAYTRIIGGGYTDPATREALQLRGIGGMYFIYGCAAVIPLLCCGVENTAGRKRLLLLALTLLLAATVCTAQLTYPTVFMLLVLAVELLSALARRLSRGRLNRWVSLLVGFLPLIVLLLWITPIVNTALAFAEKQGLGFVRNSLTMLRTVTDGGIGGVFQRIGEAFESIRQNPPVGIENDGESWNDAGRLILYLYSVLGFTRAPLFGSLLSETHFIGYHSDILDSLSGCGLIGTALSAAILGIVGRGTLRPAIGTKKDIHIFLTLLVCFLSFLLNPVVSGREMSAMVMLGLLLTLPEGDCDGTAEAASEQKPHE